MFSKEAKRSARSFVGPRFGACNRVNAWWQTFQPSFSNEAEETSPSTQTTDGYGDDDFEDFTETIKPGARTVGAASKLQDAVLGWLEYKRCDAPPEKTEWTLNEVRASVCVDGDVSSASFEKLGWKVCHQALTRLKAPNRGPTKDLADRLASLLTT